MLKHFSEYLPDAISHFKGSATQPLPPFIDPGIFSDFDGIDSRQTAENLLIVADIARGVGAKLTQRDLDLEMLAFKITRRK